MLCREGAATPSLNLNSRCFPQQRGAPGAPPSQCLCTRATYSLLGCPRSLGSRSLPFQLGFVSWGGPTCLLVVHICPDGSESGTLKAWDTNEGRNRILCWSSSSNSFLPKYGEQQTGEHGSLLWLVPLEHHVDTGILLQIPGALLI